MAHKRPTGETNVTCWLTEEEVQKLEKIRLLLESHVGFHVPRGSAIKHLINKFDLEA